MGLHLLKGLNLKMTEMTFAVFYQGAHLLSTVAGKYSASSHTAPTPVFRAQSIINGRRVSEIKSQQAKSQPVNGHHIPTTTVTLLGTSFTQISTLESLPSAGRLPVCICIWEQITADPWILECVRGYRLELVCPPLQKFLPTAWGTKDQLAIREEVKNLMVKQAIQEVEPQKGQFVSQLFTVPKKDGSRRPVVNLRPLNNFIVKKRFKMEGVVLLKSLVQQGDWTVFINLKDAYLSVVVAEEHRRYLRFQWEHQLYEFLSPLWPHQRPTHLYETAQASDVINKTARNQVDSFSGRYVIDGKIQGGASEAGARDCTASTVTGLCGQL